MLDCFTSLHEAARLSFLCSLHSSGGFTASVLAAIRESRIVRAESMVRLNAQPLPRRTSSVLVSTILSLGLFQLNFLELWQSKALISFFSLNIYNQGGWTLSLDQDHPFLVIFTQFIACRI